MQSQIVVPFPFGIGKSERIRSNDLIVGRAVELARQLPCPIFTDNHLTFQPAESEGVEIHHCPFVPGRYESTLVLAKEAVKFCRDNNISRIAVVAAPPHQERCRRDLLLAATQASRSLEEVVVDTRLSGVLAAEFFCPESTQIWTRHQRLYECRDKLLDIVFAISPRLYCWLAG